MRGAGKAIRAATGQDRQKKNPYAKNALAGSAEAAGGSSRRAPANHNHVLANRQPPMEKNSMFELDPQIQGVIDRNMNFFRRVFTINTLLSPLPPAISRPLARSLNSFTRIFTQFFDPRGIQGAQKALGLAPNEERERRERR